jgi:uncharacterized protein
MNLIEENKIKIAELCNLHKVNKLYVFGSVLTEKFNTSSDIDLLVQFYQIDLIQYFDNYMDFKEKMEILLNRPVDLIEDQAVRNPIFRIILERDKKLIYERKSA